ncbi:MAG: alpha/beta hydrolase [Oscillospiraceae bacterium]|nr:alpha/beta hydrolase [Oscillospiraceae bacterium]
MFGAKNLMVDVDGAKVPVAVFGKGKKNLILLPGVGDGLATVEGKALPLALSYRILSKEYRVFVMSRRIPLPENFGTREMAEDMAKVMEKLGIEKASVIGVSMGGMIAQHFGANFPEKTEKLVLAVTAPKESEEMRILREEWIELAKEGRGVELMKSSVRNMYTDGYYRKNAWLCEITGRFMMPKSCERFIRMAFACLEHDAEAVLKNIKAPVLIIGGAEDRTVGPKGSEILAKEIENAELLMYPGLRHAVYDEAPDFEKRVANFLRKGN